MNNRPDPAAFIVVTPAMRQLIENVVEDLLLLLDEIDGDADLEEDDLAGYDATAPGTGVRFTSGQNRRKPNGDNGFTP